MSAFGEGAPVLGRSVPARPGGGTAVLRRTVRLDLPGPGRGVRPLHDGPARRQERRGPDAQDGPGACPPPGASTSPRPTPPKTAEKVTEAGGRVLFGPDTVGDVGVMAGAIDPGGSYFGLWQGMHPPRLRPGQRAGLLLLDREPHPGRRRPSTPSTAPCSDTRRSRSATASTSTTRCGRCPAARTPVAGPDEARRRRRRPRAYHVTSSVADCDDAAAAVRRLGGQVSASPQRLALRPHRRRRRRPGRALRRHRHRAPGRAGPGP